MPLDVNCNGRYGAVDLRVSERVGSRIATGYGYSEVACTGTTQRVSIRVMASSEKAFTRGSALVTANLFGCNETVCGNESSSVTIKITK